jgi:divalent metal cation (Fe/Co/Zn/Cd) transporter
MQPLDPEFSEYNLMLKKVRTARLSIISNSCLIILKVFAGIFSGSVSILSEAIHSGMDLLAAIIAFFSRCQTPLWTWQI